MLFLNIFREDLWSSNVKSDVMIFVELKQGNQSLVIKSRIINPTLKHKNTNIEPRIEALYLK